MYEMVDKDMLSGGALEPHKPQVKPKVLKSAGGGSMLGGDEVDSECRTEDEEYASNSGVKDGIVKNNNDCNSIKSAGDH